MRSLSTTDYSVLSFFAHKANTSPYVVKPLYYLLTGLWLLFVKKTPSHRNSKKEVSMTQLGLAVTLLTLSILFLGFLVSFLQPVFELLGRFSLYQGLSSALLIFLVIRAVIGKRFLVNNRDKFASSLDRN